MDESIEREFATDTVGSLTNKIDFSLQECIDNSLWSVRPNKKYSLEFFSNSVFGQSLNIGEMITTADLRFLRLWPDSAWLISSRQDFPQQILEFKELVTDLSHGICELQLQGKHVLSFLNNYCPVNLNQDGIRIARTVRTVICHFQVTLWWDEVSDVRILVDRSYAHSLSLHLQALFARWP